MLESRDIPRFTLLVDKIYEGALTPGVCGLGWLLMERIIDFARQRGIHELRGETVTGNTRMQALARALGFHLTSATGTDAGTIGLRLVLTP